MIFKQLTIQGFKSVADPIVLDFDQYSTGTCFVTGENLAEPHLGANGVGKSTIWDALCWCFYGIDTKKHKASSIINWYSDVQCVVTVIIEIAGKEYEIVRTQSPNSITVNEEEKTQDQLEDLLQLNYQSFLHLVIIPQFSSKFFDLQQAERLNIFSEILQLDKWLGYSSKAKSKADDLYEIIKKDTSKIDKIDGQIKQLESDILSLLSRGERWVEQRQERLDLVEKEIDENQANRIPWQEQLESAITALNPLLNERFTLLESSDKLKMNKLKASKKLKIAEKQRDVLSYDLRKYKEDWDAFNELEGQCPHCEQNITQEYLDEKLNVIKEKIKNIKKSVKKSEVEVSTADLELSDIEDAIRKIELNIKKIEYDINILETTKVGFENKLKKADWELKNLERNRDAIENDSNPFYDMKLEAEDEITLLKSDRRTKRRNLKQLNIEYNIYKYWIRGFKEIRLFVIEEALLELQLQINNNLEKLGLYGWKVELSIDHENKSGKVKRGFTICIKSPHNEDLVPFKCYSGGEGQRLKIAGTLGLSDFISSRTGITSNIEVWDEATSWMSNEGVRDLMQILFDRSEELNKTIFVVDHRDLNTYGEFTNILHITKDEEGTKINE